jgi:hypothetical protein
MRRRSVGSRASLYCIRFDAVGAAIGVNIPLLELVGGEMGEIFGEAAVTVFDGTFGLAKSGTNCALA